MSPLTPYASKPIFSAIALRLASCSSSDFTMMRPGMPTAVAPAGTARVTTAFEPILAPAPTVNGPRILAPAPTITPSSNVGWRLPLFQLVPPSVTP
ncbi:hypothetical protein D3C77_699370 [compost metagenome]